CASAASASLGSAWRAWSAKAGYPELSPRASLAPPHEARSKSEIDGRLAPTTAALAAGAVASRRGPGPEIRRGRDSTSVSRPGGRLSLAPLEQPNRLSPMTRSHRRCRRGLAAGPLLPAWSSPDCGARFSCDLTSDGWWVSQLRTRAPVRCRGPPPTGTG